MSNRHNNDFFAFNEKDGSVIIIQPYTIVPFEVTVQRFYLHVINLINHWFKFVQYAFNNWRIKTPEFSFGPIR